MLCVTGQRPPTQTQWNKKHRRTESIWARRKWWWANGGKRLLNYWSTSKTESFECIDMEFNRQVVKEMTLTPSFFLSNTHTSLFFSQLNWLPRRNWWEQPEKNELEWLLKYLKKKCLHTRMWWNKNELAVCLRICRHYIFCAPLSRCQPSVNAYPCEMTKLNFNRNDFHNSI